MTITQTDFIRSILQNASNGKLTPQIVPNKTTPPKKRYRIKEIRKQQRMTLGELSQLTNISVAYLSRLENGHNKLNEKLLFKLSKALCCSPSEILGQDGKLFVSSADNTMLTALYVSIHPLKLFGDERQSEIWKCYIDFNDENEEIAIPQSLANKKNIIAIRITFDHLSPSYLSGETIILADEIPSITGRLILILDKSSNSALIGSFCGYENGEIAIKSEFCKSSTKIKFEIEKTENIKVYSIVGRFDPS